MPVEMPALWALLVNWEPTKVRASDSLVTPQLSNVILVCPRASVHHRSIEYITQVVVEANCTWT